MCGGEHVCYKCVCPSYRADAFKALLEPHAYGLLGHLLLDGVLQLLPGQQLLQLLAVRHSVFIIGNAGTGKSQVLRSLQKTYQNMKRRPVWADLNPKAVTNDELFGIINPATREWKDGNYGEKKSFNI